jgi:NTP pyrophosphatase (non-canonical NTP hydrolase)
LNPHFDDIVQDVYLECRRQDEKWGCTFPGRPDSYWLTILTEEVGELAEAILDENETHIHEEAIQVAAVIFKFLELRSQEDKS